MNMLLFSSQWLLIFIVQNELYDLALVKYINYMLWLLAHNRLLCFKYMFLMG